MTDVGGGDCRAFMENEGLGVVNSENCQLLHASVRGGIAFDACAAGDGILLVIAR